MSEQNSWSYFTVRDFFEKYNWSGQEPIQTNLLTDNSGDGEPFQTTLLERNADSSSTTKTWQCQTVQDFLGQCNWTGRTIRQQESLPSPQVLSSNHESSTSQELSTCFAVKDFFQFFVWEGQPSVGVVSEVQSPLETDHQDELSLNDFSDLF